ncbi:MAG: mechanosensitive ion channel family protein [Chloroflexi bacterium]|nr:mechanosensitive ion channel family protein [Chloroflexota bacterium]
MVPTIIRGEPLLEVLYALGIVVVSLGLARVTTYLFKVVIERLAARSSTNLDDLLLRALRRPAGVFVVIQGTFIALTAITLLNEWQAAINKGWGVLMLATAFWAIQRGVNVLLTWWGQELASRAASDWDNRVLPILRRASSFAILAIGALVVLERLGVSISPLLAGLGIGGLAVAIALQPTLSSFISGTYLLTDGSIRPGDFIEVQGGPSGTVLDVGWRSTKLLNPPNNVVTVPNSRLADSIVTNYNLPAPATNVVLSCGVSYESDLKQVEAQALEVMREVRDRLPEADKSSDPWVGFSEFGDSNITFFCVLRAVNRGASFLVRSELIKALHHRFQQEGIEINYPVRKLVYAGDGKTDHPLSLKDETTRG